jgi:hypothetical protein
VIGLVVQAERIFLFALMLTRNVLRCYHSVVFQSLMMMLSSQPTALWDKTQPMSYMMDETLDLNIASGIRGGSNSATDYLCFINTGRMAK